MSNLLDTIENGFNSLLEPLTGQATETTTARSSTATASAVVTPTTLATVKSSSETTATSVKTSSSSIEKASTTSSETSVSTSSSTLDSSTTSSKTTLSTSTTRSSSEISSTTSLTQNISLQTTPPAPAATSTQAAASTTSSKDSGSGISTAGIVLAVVFGVALLASIIYLTLRFCPAIRRRLDAFYQRRRDERSYREAIDGPAVPEKDDTSSLGSTTRSLAYSGPAFTTDAEKSRLSLAAAKDLNIPRRPLSSFFALGRNPQVQSAPSYTERQPHDTRFSRQIPSGASQQETLHQQYSSPNSAASERAREQGLGLGRVSLLRNHSLLRKAGYDVPYKMLGPSKTAAQAEIAVAGAVRMKSGTQDVALREVKSASIVRTLESVRPAQQQEIRRKPVGNARADDPVIKNNFKPHPFSQQAHERRDRGTSPPRLNIEISPAPERLSQIGMAVSGTPQPTQEYGFGYAR